MGDFSSYYKYEKFEVIGDELIPLGIYSIDADGTMPYVVKEECDTACGCIEPQYRWIQTEDTICIEVLTQTVSGSPYCVGYDRYEDVYSQVSYDNGVTWKTTATTSTMIEENSSACGYVPPTPTTEYRWVDDGGTTCVGVDKYNRKVKQVSYDGGSTWMNVSPLTVSATTLVEANSPDCGYIAPQYRTISGDPYCTGVDKYEDVYSQVSYDGGSSWETTATTATLVQAKSTDCGFSARTISTATTCVGVDKHYLDEYQESYDFGQTWTTISSSTGTLIEAKSADCGYVPPTPTQYRWTQSGTTCIGYDKYQNNIKEQSTDGGTTWTVVIPEEYSASTLIESQSTDCGYVPPTPTIDGKFKLTLNDSSTVSAECDSTSSVTSGEVATQYSGSVTPALVKAEIGDCVKTIGGSAFNKCSGLTSVTISDNVKSISEFAFGSCTSLVTCNMGTGVTKMGNGAFYNCSSLTSITIPNGVTSIKSWTFYQCYSLTSITIPNGVTSIGQAAFLQCTGLTGSLLIPDSVTSIGGDAFYNCTSLTSITINATTPPALGESTFSVTNNCPIYVPCASVDTYKAASGWSNYASRIEGIPPCGSPTPTIDGKFQATNLDSSTFSAECDSTSAVTGEDIGNSYARQPKIINITIGDCVTSIGDTTFWLCTGLTSVSISNSVTTIGNGAFIGCHSLTSVTIPSGVTSIGNTTFANCYSLTSVTIPSGVTSIGQQAFYKCSGLTSVNIPSSVTSIGEQAFRNCTSLTSIEIPNGVTTIGIWAFSDNVNLTSVTIGSGVTTIAGAAFQNCTNLTSITILATTPPSLGYLNDQMVVFDNTNNCPIYVPSGSVDAYKSAMGWRYYASRIQPIT